MFRILTAGSYKRYDDVFIKEIGKCTCVHSDILTDFLRATGKEESREIMSRVHKAEYVFFYIEKQRNTYFNRMVVFTPL